MVKYVFLVVCVVTSWSRQLTLAMPMSTTAEIMPHGVENGDLAMTPEEIAQGWTEVTLPIAMPLFGDVKYSTAYVNTRGAITFQNPLSTWNLTKIRENILIFGPLIMEPSEAGISVTYRVVSSPTELSAFDQACKIAVGDATFQAKVGIIASFDSGEHGNFYQIVIASDGEKTYSRYAFEMVGDAETNGNYARSGVFAKNDFGFMCSNEVQGSGNVAISAATFRSNVGLPSNYYWKVHLPLECGSRFLTDCEELLLDRNLALYEVGRYMETRENDEWAFYNLQFCLPGAVFDDGTVSTKVSCQYSPDDYENSWTVPDTGCKTGGQEGFPDFLFAVEPSGAPLTGDERR